MSSKLEKQVGEKVGSAAKALLSRINIDALANQVIPKMLPGMLARMPIAQQMGFDEAGISALFNASPDSVASSESSDIDIPSGGNRKLTRLIAKGEISPEHLAEAVIRVMMNEDFDSVSESFGDVLYLAFAHDCLEREEKAEKGRKEAINVDPK